MRNSVFLMLSIIILLNLSIFGQTIVDVNGNSIKYNKVGKLYITENIKTTSLWGTKQKLTQLKSAPMPQEMLGGGGYTMDLSSMSLYSGRYFINFDNSFYYTWNTANNQTSVEYSYYAKKYEKTSNENTNVTNSSICPCGWRVPNTEDLSELLVTTKIFNSKEEFNEWFSSIYYSKIALKKDINKILVENKLFNKSEFVGFFDRYEKPLLGDSLTGFWLSNVGESIGPQMQVDGLVLFINKKPYNKMNLGLKPFMSTQMMPVKCVTDENGMKIYLEWSKKIEEEQAAILKLKNQFDSLVSSSKLIEAYSVLENLALKNPITELKWGNYQESSWKQVERGERKKNEKGQEYCAFGVCEFSNECGACNSSNSTVCKGHADLLNDLRNSNNITNKLYVQWNDAFVSKIDEIIENSNIEDTKKLIAFYETKKLVVFKQSEINVINKWKNKLSNIEFNILIEPLKNKSLSPNETNLIGDWDFKSKPIKTASGEKHYLIEVWRFNTNRTFYYLIQEHNYIDNRILSKEERTGYWSFDNNNLNIIIDFESKEKEKKRVNKVVNINYSELTDANAKKTFELGTFRIEMVGKKRK